MTLGSVPGKSLARLGSGLRLSSSSSKSCGECMRGGESSIIVQWRGRTTEAGAGRGGGRILAGLKSALDKGFEQCGWVRRERRFQVRLRVRR